MTGGRQRRKRLLRKARQAAGVAEATHISSLGDDLVREIFLRLPSLVRHACTCPAWRRVVASSPAFRRRFRALHPAPLLGLFADNEYSGHFRLPAFAPADDSRSDADVLAALRGGDFGLAALDAQERDAGEVEPRRWLVADCRDGYLLLVNWDAAVLAAVNPISPRRLSYIPLPYVKHREDITDRHRGYVKGLRDVHWLSSSDDDPMSFRLVWLYLDESRVRAAVFSSATWDWRILPWVEVARMPQEEDEWLQSGTQANGVLCWRIGNEENLLILDTKTMSFSVWELSGLGLLALDNWQHGSLGVVAGEAKNGDLCIVRHTPLSIKVLTRQADYDGVEKWLTHDRVLSWDEDFLIDNYGRLDSLAIMAGILYFVAGEVVMSLCLETMRMEELFTTPSDLHYSFARLYPYFVAWPPSLVGNRGRFVEVQDDPGNA
ncbi:hypothetical protein EJB05_54823, partial [Eragrostis curvula]